MTTTVNVGLDIKEETVKKTLMTAKQINVKMVQHVKIGKTPISVNVLKVCQLKHPIDYHIFLLIGYSGQFCEVKINECNYNPCQNEGRCQTLETGYKCDCRPGFTGL